MGFELQFDVREPASHCCSDTWRAGATQRSSRRSTRGSRFFVLLGISLGGVFAPALAREKAVRGIVVFGTLATRPPAYPGRSERFFTEFDAVDVPAAWAAIDTRLLMRHGPGDLGIERRGPGFPADARLSSIVRSFLLCVVSAFRRT